MKKTIDNSQKVCYTIIREKERTKNKSEQMLKSGKHLKAADGLNRVIWIFSNSQERFGGMQIPQIGAKFQLCGVGTGAVPLRRERSESPMDATEIKQSSPRLVKI